MEKIKTVNLTRDGVEFAAGLFFNEGIDDLSKMDQDTFEEWLEDNRSRKTIILGDNETTVPETSKEAFLRHIESWYYRNLHEPTEV